MCDNRKLNHILLTRECLYDLVFSVFKMAKFTVKKEEEKKDSYESYSFGIFCYIFSFFLILLNSY